MTAIQWTDVTWNPVRGCSRISEGCRNCYAERVAARFSGPGQPFEGFAVQRPGSASKWTGRVELVPEKLREPLAWRKPCRVFVNSMSDLFHESLPDGAIDAVFAVMALAPQHTFQVLTKRAERMRLYFSGPGWKHRAVAAPGGRGIARWDNPLPNVWLGVSVEHQLAADERIPLLLQTPAAVRFLSVEPLLGPVDLGLQSATCSCCARWSSRWVRLKHRVSSDVYLGYRPDLTVAGGTLTRADSNPHGALSVRTPGGLLGIKPAEFDCLPALDWVIVGGESGPGARPCDVAWVRSVVEQCKAAGVACFVKQLGAYAILDPRFDRSISGTTRRLADPKGGDPAEWPEDLRVREFPAVRP